MVVVAGVVLVAVVQEETYLVGEDHTSSSVADIGDTERIRAGRGGTPWDAWGSTGRGRLDYWRRSWRVQQDRWR